MNGDGTGGKALDTRVIDKSVVQKPAAPVYGPTGDSIILWVSQIADTIEPWGQRFILRDKQLRDFFPTENFLMSALAIIAGRNAALSWTLEGADKTVQAAQELLLNANFGNGWQEFITQLSIDLYTQDCGAYVEIVRESDSEKAPVIGINHLDAARCFLTGVPEKPVMYQRENGEYEFMPWYRVVHLLETPSPVHKHSSFLNVQYSAVTRLLLAAQVLQNVTKYKEEKTGGRFQRGIHLVAGIKEEQIQSAINQHREFTDNAGLTRYTQPAIISSVDPSAQITHTLLELASLPEGWSEDDSIKNYILILAMAFQTDYQEFAPLPGGGLGTSTQSYVLHMKSRGKGPALFQKLITHMLNFRGILPRNVEFRFDEQDLDEEKDQAELMKLRAESLNAYVQTSVLTPEAVRQIMVDNGDLSEDVFKLMGQQDTTAEVTREEEDKPEAGEGGEQVTDEEFDEKSYEEAIDERLALEDEVAGEIAGVLRRVRRRVNERLRTAGKDGDSDRVIT